MFSSALSKVDIHGTVRVPGGRGLPYKKDRDRRGEFCKEPPAGVFFLLCGRGLNFFHHQETQLLTLTFFGSIP